MTNSEPDSTETALLDAQEAVERVDALLSFAGRFPVIYSHAYRPDLLVQDNDPLAVKRRSTADWLGGLRSRVSSDMTQTLGKITANLHHVEIAAKLDLLPAARFFADLAVTAAEMAERDILHIERCIEFYAAAEDVRTTDAIAVPPDSRVDGIPPVPGVRCSHRRCRAEATRKNRDIGTVIPGVTVWWVPDHRREETICRSRPSSIMAWSPDMDDDFTRNYVERAKP